MWIYCLQCAHLPWHEKKKLKKKFNWKILKLFQHTYAFHTHFTKYIVVSGFSWVYVFVCVCVFVPLCLCSVVSKQFCAEFQNHSTSTSFCNVNRNLSMQTNSEWMDVLFFPTQLNDAFIFCFANVIITRNFQQGFVFNTLILWQMRLFEHF